MAFNQTGFRHSMEGWIGDFKSVKEVQEADNRELAEIGGSYKEIARRMQEMWDFANFFHEQRKDIIPYEEWRRTIDPVLRRFKMQDRDFHKNSKLWESYSREWARLRSQDPRTHLDGRVAVLQYLSTRGFQVCPFEPCGETWKGDVEVMSRKTGRLLTINRGTIHMAREHHFLEKGNKYGITAREFYEGFM